MPVAQSKIGEPGKLWSVGSNEIGNILVVRAESFDSAVSQPHPDDTFGQIHVIHVGREIIERPAMKQRCGQNDEVLEYLRPRRHKSADVLGQFFAEELIPEPVGAVRVMIARQQMPPDARKIAHPLQWLVERTWRQRLHVVDITRHQNVRCPVFPGEFTQPRYDPQSSFLQKPHRRIVDKAEDLPDLPVRRMDELDSHRSSPTRLNGTPIPKQSGNTIRRIGG